MELVRIALPTDEKLVEVLIPLLIVELFADEVCVGVHRFHGLHDHVREAKDDPGVRPLFFPRFLYIRDSRVQSAQVANKLVVHGVFQVTLRLQLFLSFIDLSDKLGDRSSQVSMLSIVATVRHDVLPYELIV